MTFPKNFPLPQTDYSQFPPNGFNGQLADYGFKDIETFLADAAMGEAFGVCTGAGEDRIKLPAGATDVTGAAFKGITIYNAMQEPKAFPTISTTLRYAQFDAVPVMRRGRMWIMPLHDVAEDGAVFCVTTTINFGKLSGTNEGATASKIPGCICLKGSTIASGIPALIELNLTQSP